MHGPLLLIHGGLSSKAGFEKEYDETRASLRDIAARGYVFLKTHSAVETAIFLTRELEDNPLFNAGTGSRIQADGHIRMSAALMDGATKIFSGVVNIENVKNPIAVAGLLQKEKDRVLAGPQANLYAEKLGIKYHNPETKKRRDEFERLKGEKGHGTIGCVVRDSEGRLAAATSTGGKGWEIPGRVSDSATVAGNFANEYCAVSATGIGEDAVSVGLAAAIAVRVADGMDLHTASDKILATLKNINGEAGYIGLSLANETVAAASTPYLTWAKASAEGIESF